MTENKQPLNQRDENIDRTTTELYARRAGASTGARLTKEENQPTTRYQSDTYPAGISSPTLPREEYEPTIKRQTEPPASTGISPVLARALVGGLIGATLGTLAGALANKRTSEGVNHAVKGVGNALKNVGEGLNLAAKGVGDAVKSVGEGASHAVVGGTLDAANGIAEGAKQTVVGALDAVKDTAEDAGQSDKQSFKIAKERLVAEKPQNTTGEIGIQKYDKTQTVYTSPSVQSEQLGVAQTTPIGAGMPVASSEVDFQEGEVALQEVNEQTPNI